MPVTTPRPGPAFQPSALMRAGFYVLAVGMALLHAFITFRGLSSAEGMEQAQIARELARGNGFQTKAVRPFAWAQIAGAGREVDAAALPATAQPPVQPLLWAPVFALLHRHQDYDPARSGAIYLLDRAVACIGVTGFLLTIFLIHGSARLLFDEAVAGVCAVALVLCEPLWEAAVSGGGRGLLLPLFALAFRLYVSAMVTAHGGGTSLLRWLLLAVVAGVMVLTHWLAVWLALGIVAAVAVCVPTRRWAAIVVALGPVLALGAWGWWCQQLCGDVLGGAKTLFQAHLLYVDPQTMSRAFTTASPPIFLDDVLRKLGDNWQAQLGDMLTHAGWLLPAVFFLAALLHPFRRPETLAAVRGLGLMLLAVAVGLGLLGLPDRAADDNALYLVLAPAMSIFGTAMLAVLWARLLPGDGLWSRWGAAVIAIALSAIPMAVKLPVHVKLGLTMGSKFFPHWPPYVPDRVSVVEHLLEPGEVVFTDAPWFVAWYADVPAIWTPEKRADYEQMKTVLEKQKHAVAGFIVTPVSARINYLSDAFTGPYREWPDLIFRGPMLAFDKDFQPNPGFPFKVPLPLIAQPVGEKENLSLLMTFYTDKVRKVRK